MFGEISKYDLRGLKFDLPRYKGGKKDGTMCWVGYSGEVGMQGHLAILCNHVPQ